MDGIGISKKVREILIKKGPKEIKLLYSDKQSSATINLDKDTIIKSREIITCKIASPDDFKVKIFLESTRKKKDIHYSFVTVGSNLEKILVANQEIWIKNSKNSRENVCPQYEVILDI